MIDFTFDTNSISNIDDRERDCANLARIIETLGKGTSSVQINGVTVNAEFYGASMDAELTKDGNMILEMVFANGTSVHIEVKTSDRITIDNIEGFLFIFIYR